MKKVLRRIAIGAAVAATAAGIAAAPTAANAAPHRPVHSDSTQLVTPQVDTGWGY